MVFDATVGYRMPARRGILSLGVSNMFNESFKLQDQSFRTADRVGDLRLVPERTVLAQLTLSF